MTKNEAKQVIASLSDGTLATLTGITSYNSLNRELVLIFNAIDEADVSKCNTWQEVWQIVKYIIVDNIANSAVED